MTAFVPQFFFAENCAHSISLLQLLKTTDLSDKFQMVDATAGKSGVLGTPALWPAAEEPVLYGDHAFDYVSSVAAAVAKQQGPKEALGGESTVARGPRTDQPPPAAAAAESPGASGPAMASTIEDGALDMFDCEAMMPREA